MQLLNRLITGTLILGIIFLSASIVSPSESVIEESVVIHAPAPVVFEQVNVLRSWENWSEWKNLDTAVFDRGYSGQARGVGCTHEWASSDPRVGHGRTEITESEPYEWLKMDIRMGPVSGESTWHFQSDVDSVFVSWKTRVPLNFTQRIWPGWFLTDASEPYFIASLKNLKAYTESLR
ncbi:MAG: SRPBCC family protein [Flavobacteriales bacterium]|nr:SRPBCC family protein [Flavobacteriales bacterium]MCB9447492.1 SRPBCC family protein [Flavobacteriales bacterium]